MNKNYIYLILVLIIGFLLRLYNLVAISLWHDEAFSALLIKYSWGEMFQRIAADVHPPFYYIVLRFWHYIFGDGLFALRFFSLFFGILTIVFVYLFIKKAFKNDFLAIVSALLIAINPFQIQFSQEMRMYTLGAFLLMFSSWMLVMAIQSGRWRDWVFYGIAAGLALQTHYFLIFSVLAQAVYLIVSLIWSSRAKISELFKGKLFKASLVAYAVAFLVFLPWLMTFFKQFNQVQENYWIPPMEAISIPVTLWKMVAADWNTIAIHSFGINIQKQIVGENFFWVFSAVFIIILAFVLFKNRKEQFNGLVLSSFLVPFLLAIVLSFKRSLYMDRYFIFAGLFYLIILAMFFTAIKWRALRSVSVTIVVLISFYFYVSNWQNINVLVKPGMTAAASYINQNAGSNDKIYVGSPFVYFTFKYYNQSGLYPLLYTPNIKTVGELPHFSGTALLNDSDLIHDFNVGTKSGDRVWLLWTTGFGSSKPEVPANWQQVDEKGYEDVYGYRGWIVVTSYLVQ